MAPGCNVMRCGVYTLNSLNRVHVFRKIAPNVPIWIYLIHAGNRFFFSLFLLPLLYICFFVFCSFFFSFFFCFCWNVLFVGNISLLFERKKEKKSRYTEKGQKGERMRKACSVHVQSHICYANRFLNKLIYPRSC